MRIIPAFDPSTPTTQPYISLGAADSGCKILLYNESNYNLKLDFYNGSNSILHAWEARYWTLDGDTPQVNWSVESVLAMTNPPISSVKGELYEPNEKLEGNYPVGLIRATTVGNPGGVTTSVASTNAIINDGNAIGTSIIESTVTGQSSSSVKIFNDGTGTIAELIGGILVQVVKLAATDPVLALGAASHLVEVLGNLQTDGTFTIANTTHSTSMRVDTSGNFFMKSVDNAEFALGVGNVDGSIIDAFAGATTFIKSPSDIQLQVPSGTTVAKIDGTGLNFNATGKGITWKTGDTLSVTHKFTGNGSGTYSHGCVTTPFAILPICTTVNSSMTMGVDSITTTQVHVTCGNAFTFTAVGFVG